MGRTSLFPFSWGRDFLLLCPALILFALFTIVPLILVCYLGLFKTNFVHTSFVGIGNYVRIFRDPAFYKLLVNSLVYSGLLVIGWTGIPLFIALAAYNMPNWLKAYVRFIFYVPVFASGVIISTVWIYILHPTHGLANWILSLVGVSPRLWLGGRLLSIRGTR